MTPPGIEPRSPGPLANILTIMPMSGMRVKDGPKQLEIMQKLKSLKQKMKWITKERGKNMSLFID